MPCLTFRRWPEASFFQMVSCLQMSLRLALSQMVCVLVLPLLLVPLALVPRLATGDAARQHHWPEAARQHHWRVALARVRTWRQTDR